MGENYPRWHGWATPDQVREMMNEMIQWLAEHDNKQPYEWKECGYKYSNGQWIYYEDNHALV